MISFRAIEKRSPSKIPGEPISGISISEGRDSWVGFNDVIEAIHFKEKRLDIFTKINVPNDTSREMDMMLFGSSVRDILSGYWRAEQYERMLRGQDFSLTDGISVGLAGPSAIIAAEILNADQDTGWSARMGIVRRSEDKFMEHAWLQHEDGTILDITADQFLMSPVLCMAPGQEAIWEYEDHGPAYYPDQQEMVDRWKQSFPDSLVEKSRLCADRMIAHDPRDPEDTPQI